MLSLSKLLPAFAAMAMGAFASVLPAPGPSAFSSSYHHDGDSYSGHHHGKDYCATTRLSVIEADAHYVVHPALAPFREGTFEVYKAAVYENREGKKGKKVGELYGTCAGYTKRTPTWKSQCVREFTMRFLENEEVVGTLSMTGPEFDTEIGRKYPFTVTGGTGKYFAARGVDMAAIVGVGADSKWTHDLEITSCTPY